MTHNDAAAVLRTCTIMLTINSQIHHAHVPGAEEVVGCFVMLLCLQTYLAAGRRNGLSDAAGGYWELHIKEDERHGRQMLEEVALPLVDM